MKTACVPRSYYDWLDENLDKFLWSLKPEWEGKVSSKGMIVAHGDKCRQYRLDLENNGIPFEHGAAMYMLTYLLPWSGEVREVQMPLVGGDTAMVWVSPLMWMIQNYQRFKPYLPPPL